MTPDRWQKLKILFAQAVQLSPDERGKYLDQECGSDEVLRQEIEALLKSNSQASQFIERPAVDKVASAILTKNSQLTKGEKIAHYEIEGSLGFGGMGEVYLATDVRLKRKVALKLLPPDLTNNRERLQRFEQEARAISALNHPNILTIYDIGKHEDCNFIATEYIDGLTWRRQASSGPTTITEIIETATQVAIALSAAHESGIVHRDIKPENVMLRRDGIVKVLDFGLAKSIDTPTNSSFSQMPTRMVATDPGTVMGTVSYMSPEQTRGTDVDARTDVWSLGVVIYELVSGTLPFAGETTSDVIASILKTRPRPLSEVAPKVHPELQRIVSKCLSFDKADRYATATELSADLKKLKQELELNSRLSSTAHEETIIGDSMALASPAAIETDAGTRIQTRIETPSPSRSIWKVLLPVLGGLVFVALIGYFGFKSVGTNPTNATPIDTIAVLPFTNGAQNPDAEYLSDGITESLINSLSQLPSLKVKSASSVFRYKGKTTDVQAIGKELKVGAVLVGDVKQLGNQLLINVELIDVADGHHIWGNQYARQPDDVLVIQRGITQEVTSQLRVKWTQVDKDRLAKRTTDNPEAYRLYLKGRYHAVKMTPQDFEKGIAYLREAITIDPGYALAYSGLSFYYVQSLDQILPPKEAMEKARNAAVQAISLDDTLSEAHIALGFVYWQYDWNWKQAEYEFAKAIELNPNSSEAHGTYGFFLVLMGRFDEGLKEVDKANDASPLSIEMSLYGAPGYYFSRRYPEAIDKATKAIEFAPDFWLPHLIAGRAHEKLGNYDAALDEYKKAHAIDSNSPEILMDLGRVYGLKGDKGEALKVLKELEERRKTTYVSPFQIAMVHLGLGDKDKCLASLEEAFTARSWYMTWLRVAPELDPLRSDPRYIDLTRRVGL